MYIDYDIIRIIYFKVNFSGGEYERGKYDISFYHEDRINNILESAKEKAKIKMK